MLGPLGMGLSPWRPAGTGPLLFFQNLYKSHKQFNQSALPLSYGSI